MDNRFDVAKLGEGLSRANILPAGIAAQDRAGSEAGFRPPDLRLARGLNVDIHRFRLAARIGKDDGESTVRIGPEEVAGNDLAIVRHHLRGGGDAAEDASIRQTHIVARCRVAWFLAEQDLVADGGIRRLPVTGGDEVKGRQEQKETTPRDGATKRGTSEHETERAQAALYFFPSAGPSSRIFVIRMGGCGGFFASVRDMGVTGQQQQASTVSARKPRAVALAASSVRERRDKTCCGSVTSSQEGYRCRESPRGPNS